MNRFEIATGVGLILVVALYVFLKKRMPLKPRAIWSAVMFIFGMSGLCTVMIFSNKPWMQIETVAYGSLAVFASCGLLGALGISSVFGELAELLWTAHRKRK